MCHSFDRLLHLCNSIFFLSNSLIRTVVWTFSAKKQSMHLHRIKYIGFLAECGTRPKNLIDVLFIISPCLFFLSFWASDNIFRCNFEVLNAENDVCIKVLVMRHFKTHLDLLKLRPLDMIFNFVYKFTSSSFFWFTIDTCVQLFRTTTDHNLQIIQIDAPFLIFLLAILFFAILMAGLNQCTSSSDQLFLLVSLVFFLWINNTLVGRSLSVPTMEFLFFFSFLFFACADGLLLSCLNRTKQALKINSIHSNETAVHAVNDTGQTIHHANLWFIFHIFLRPFSCYYTHLV